MSETQKARKDIVNTVLPELIAESVRSHTGAGLWGYEHIHVGAPKALAQCADKNKWSATFMHKLVK